MWEIFPFILNLKVKIRCWKVTVGWPRPGDSRGLGSETAPVKVQCTSPRSPVYCHFYTFSHQTDDVKKNYFECLTR